MGTRKLQKKALGPEELADRLLTVVSNRGKLERAYLRYLEVVLDGPLWSDQQPNGLRIPWRSANAARKHPQFREAFECPGLYLFGSDAGVPLYLGMTTTTLWKRLSRRYVRGGRSQCQLAVDYEQELLAHGIDGFPKEVRAWYQHNYPGSTVRLQGALTFAQHGIQGIWFTPIPTRDPDAPGRLEQSLMPVAEAWNRDRSYPALLNVHYTVN